MKENEATSSDNDKSVKLVHNHTTYFLILVHRNRNVV